MDVNPVAADTARTMLDYLHPRGSSKRIRQAWRTTVDDRPVAVTGWGDPANEKAAAGIGPMARVAELLRLWTADDLPADMLAAVIDLNVNALRAHLPGLLGAIWYVPAPEMMVRRLEPTWIKVGTTRDRGVTYNKLECRFTG